MQGRMKRSRESRPTREATPTMHRFSKKAPRSSQSLPVEGGGWRREGGGVGG